MPTTNHGAAMSSIQGLGIQGRDDRRPESTSPKKGAVSPEKRKPWEKLWSLDYSLESGTK